MTREERDALIQEAKRRYPIGTYFKSSMDGTYPGYIRTGEMYWWKDSDIVANVPGGTSVYTNGKWAEITHNPAQTVINNYDIY